MGLDNSIEVKHNEYTNNIPELQRFARSWDTEKKYDFEIVYFRKCWNVRSVIFDAVPGTYNNDISDPLSIEDIDNIIKGLQSFNADNWQEIALGSIWDWEKYKSKIQEDIENLRYLKELMKKYDLEVYFYDSY